MDRSHQTEALSIGLQCRYHFADDGVERHAKLLRATKDVLAVHGASERFVFHLLFYGPNIDVVNALGRTNEGDSDNETA